MTTRAATLTGFAAVLMWSALAVLTVGTAPVPPFLLNAMTFGLGAVVGLVWTLKAGGLHLLARVPWQVYAMGSAGLFLYHFFYFSALRLAPPAQAGLIAYLWPLLIVLFSSLLPGERLRAGHVLGAVCAFAGAAAVLWQGFGTGMPSGALAGYALAMLCALIWAGYSVASRRFGMQPTASVTVFCLATALLSVPCHLIWETTAWPEGPVGWASVAALGLGPVGLAFFAWDIGMKRGDIRLLGTLSYAAPLLSTLALVGSGRAEANWTLLPAAFLITTGALIAARASR